MQTVQQQAQQLNQLHYSHLRELNRLGASISSQGEDGVLLCLYTEGRALLSGELVDKTGLTTGRIANILRQLEEKALIQRLQDGMDRRRVHVNLTQAGRLRAQALDAQTTQAHEQLLRYLGPQDADELLRLLERCLSYAAEQFSIQ